MRDPSEKPLTPPSPSCPPVPLKAPSREDESEGLIDLDDHDQINNQHPEVR